jgi:UDP-N-acetylglucosamine 2-epimerase (non-hydrolysing)/GDP/UDP-N,N'-diacetylbacillosamine 2-epimerase (hydrolysing)
MRKICVVTGSRADYGLLHWVMHAIRDSKSLELQVVASGMHLSPEFGMTVRGIEADGFAVAARVDMQLTSDSGPGIGKSIGLGVIGFADAFAALAPDMLVVLGDRFETLAAVTAALPARLPVAHVAGGDVTEGSFDDATRHAITKMSHLHFVTSDDAARRLAQLGEEAWRIHNVGSPGIDYVHRLEPLGRVALERELGVKLRRLNLLVTFHPPTVEPGLAAGQFTELLAALDSLGPEIGLIFTFPNADNEGRSLIALLKAFVAAHPNALAYPSLGQRLYLSLMREVDALVGNSSSALYEAPTLRKPAVNIGDRQKGRLHAASIVNSAPVRNEIVAAIAKALALDCSCVVNPYGEGRSAERIVATLLEASDRTRLLRKKFVDA